MGILTAKVLTKACGSHIPVELMNPTENDIKLEKYTNLGYASRVQEEDLLCSLKKRLSEELNDLIEDIEETISGTDRKKFRQLLLNNQEIFGTKDEPFGKTDLVKHDIVTEKCQPIKQHVRRIPFHLRSEAD